MKYNCHGKVIYINYPDKTKKLACQIESNVRWPDPDGKAFISIWQDNDDKTRFIGLDIRDENELIVVPKDMFPLLTLAREEDARFEIELDDPKKKTEKYELKAISVGRLQ